MLTARRLLWIPCVLALAASVRPAQGGTPLPLAAFPDGGFVPPNTDVRNDERDAWTRLSAYREGLFLCIRNYFDDLFAGQASAGAEYTSCAQTKLDTYSARISDLLSDGNIAGDAMSYAVVAAVVQGELNAVVPSVFCDGSTPAPAFPPATVPTSNYRQGEQALLKVLRVAAHKNTVCIRSGVMNEYSSGTNSVANCRSGAITQVSTKVASLVNRNLLPSCISASIAQALGQAVAQLSILHTDDIFAVP